jgi:hypothetical protein
MLSATIFRVTDDIYWNEEALPAQYAGMQNGFAITLVQNFRFKSFYLDNEFQYQQFSVDSIITFPRFYSRHSLYFQDKLFKGALVSKLGFDIKYTADYYGPDYMPATGQFFVQHEDMLNFYPVVDIYLNIRVKSVRAFVMIQNLDKDVFVSGYFSAYRYPMPDRGLKLGIEWRFWN